jgi:hypothetical protein
MTDEHDDSWNSIIHYHDKISKDFPSGKAGLEAIQTIRSIMGSRWKPQTPRIAFEYHPGQSLWNRFWIGYEPNYRWLIHFARKLNVIVEIPSHEQVLDQLRSPEKYWSVLTEIDLTLKLKLSGIACKYDFQRGEPTPDVVAEIAGEKTDIEITSLNLPEEDTIGMDALSLVSMIAVSAKCASGGMWGRVPKRWELKRIRTKILAGVGEANEGRKLVEVNEPGILHCYIAPSDLAPQMKIPWYWGSFVMRTRSSTKKKDRFARAIEEKAKHQLSRGKPSVLVVYDRFSSPDEARGFVNEKELELSVGVFEKLAGVVLVCPFVTTLMTGELFPTKELTRENRSLVEYTLPDNEAEICTIWRHPLQKHRSVIESFIHCLSRFPAKLTDLYQE